MPMKNLMTFLKTVFETSADVAYAVGTSLMKRTPELVEIAGKVRSDFLEAAAEAKMGETVERCACASKYAGDAAEELVYGLKAAVTGREGPSKKERQLEQDIFGYLECDKPHWDDEVKKFIARHGAHSLVRSGLPVETMHSAEIDDAAEDFVDYLPPHSEVMEAWYDSNVCEVVMATMKKMNVRLPDGLKLGELVAVTHE
jgi:hypothetical protein